MRSTFFGLQIGQAGLATSQFGLDVTSHNIANTETQGFTRQRVVQTALLPSTGFGKALPAQSQLRVGTGTGVKIHDQIRSEFLDRRFRTENSAAAYWSARTQEMRYVESFFDSINEETSINFTLSRFFEAVKTLAENPIDGAPRTLLRDAGMDMAQHFNLIFNGLVDLQTSQNLAVEVKTGEINRLASEIVELNKAIYIYEITGHIANDLRDARNLLVDELSTIVDVDYWETSDGNGQKIFEVTIAGEKLVSHDKQAALGVYEVPNRIPGEEKVLMPTWVTNFTNSTPPQLTPKIGMTFPPGADLTGFSEIKMTNGPSLWVRTEDITIAGILDNFDLNKISGGELKAYIDMRDGTGVGSDQKGIPYYIEMLNNLTRAIVQEVNAAHRAGWTDHPVDGSRTGINFFHQDPDTYVNAAGNVMYTFNWLNNSWEDNTGTVVSEADIIAAGHTLVLGLTSINAKNVRLSNEVLESSANIAASSREIIRGFLPDGTPDFLQRGNNENMNKIYELFSLKRDIVTVDSNGKPVIINSLDSYATSIVHDVGSTTNTALNAARNGNTLITAMGNQRLAVAGVSLDEEMVSLIRFQHAYSGAARVITAMDDALDRLINGTGRVGL